MNKFIKTGLGWIVGLGLVGLCWKIGGKQLIQIITKDGPDDNVKTVGP